LPFLDGKFDVVSVPAACGGLSTIFSQPMVFHAAFAEVKVGEDVKQGVYDELLRRLEEKVKKEGLEMTKTKKEAFPELSISKIYVHAESPRFPYSTPRNSSLSSFWRFKAFMS
jgi:hypothetical protein